MREVENGSIEKNAEGVSEQRPRLDALQPTLGSWIRNENNPESGCVMVGYKDYANPIDLYLLSHITPG